MLAKKNVDPELEKLRNEIDGPPNLDTLALNIQRQTARIHAGFLFEVEGKALLKKLCLTLSSTATGKNYSNWQDFGAEIGLKIDQMRVIEYNFVGLQDPTYFVLLTYVQSSNSTLDKIISSLQKINRLDIINRVKDEIQSLIDALDHKGYINGSEIIRPACVPPAPLVLQPKESDTEISTKKIEDNVKKSQIIVTQIKKPIHTYGSRVMLSFAKNDLETANRVAKLFRSKEPKIGVLILQEHKKEVYSKGEEFIYDCFKQVDYIIPILTRDYIKGISSPNFHETMSHMVLDNKYLRYIHILMQNEYANHNCCNNRVRCIVPDKEINQVQRLTLHPTLSAWFKESDIDAFAENVLLKKF